MQRFVPRTEVQFVLGVMFLVLCAVGGYATAGIQMGVGAF
ncbi:hypothetical protein [Bradyrhizobium phage BDU-MI-1]|nr:hypothetical protein [Bradyrhizobium phage BDU-MI-1]